MLDPILVTLATTAGTQLATSMVGDGWAEVKALFAQLFARGDAGEQTRQEDRLERSRGELLAATDDPEGPGGPVEVRQRQEAAWTTRFEDLLEEAPELAGRLEELVHGLEQRNAGSVRVQALATDQAQQAVQGQGVQNNTFGSR